MDDEKRKNHAGLQWLPPKTIDVPERVSFWLETLVESLAPVYAWMNDNGLEADRLIGPAVHIKTLRDCFRQAQEMPPAPPAQTHVEQLSGSASVSPENKSLAERLMAEAEPAKVSGTFKALRHLVDDAEKLRVEYIQSLDAHPHITRHEKRAVIGYGVDPEASPEEAAKAREAIGFAFDTMARTLDDALRTKRYWTSTDEDGKTAHHGSNDQIDLEKSIPAAAKRLSETLLGIRTPGS